MTPTSLLPKIAAQRGISFPQLVERILSLATRDEAGVTEAPGMATVQPAPRAPWAAEPWGGAAPWNAGPDVRLLPVRGGTACILAHGAAARA